MEKFKPGAPKNWLYITAGLMWSAVGIWLCWLAYGWLKLETQTTSLGMLAAGLILALTIYAFGFSALANRNIQRIENMPHDSPCIFAFQSWTSYPLVAVMILMGIFLRRSSLIPWPYLAAIYTGIGGALFLASFHYYRFSLGSSQKGISTPPEKETYGT